MQKAELGLVAHTHLAAAFTPQRRVRITVDQPLDISHGKWLLNPGAVGAPVPPRRGWFTADAACWLELDLEHRVATWRRTPYDPRPARERAHALGLE